MRKAQGEQSDDEAEAPLGKVRGVARRVLKGLGGREVEDDAAVGWWWWWVGGVGEERRGEKRERERERERERKKEG